MNYGKTIEHFGNAGNNRWKMEKLFGGIYYKRKVLVTGHTGFKGSWLVYWLQKMGAKVTGYSLEPPTVPNHFSLLELKINSVIADIRNYNKLLETITRFKPEIVFHLAAQPIVINSYINPIETYSTNVIGTVNIFEACRNTKSVKAIVNVTSDKCYENVEWVWGYRENDKLCGIDPYSSSKSCSELITYSYQKSFFKKDNLLISSARAGNVIGGGDWAEFRIIPDLVKGSIIKKPVLIRNPYSIRPWQHVLEPLSGYLQLGWKLLNKEDFIGPWNFGPNEDDFITVIELANLFKSLWSDVKFRQKNTKVSFYESNFLKLDCSKARTKLKWKNVWSSLKSIEYTVKWYKNYYKSGIINTKDDLNNYIEAAKEIGAEWTL